MKNITTANAAPTVASLSPNTGTTTGGTPISMAAENMYESLQRGTIDGLITSWSAFEPYKLQEVTAYHIEAPLGATPSMFFMARKKFDALPEAELSAWEPE